MSKRTYGAGAAVWQRLGATNLRADLLPVVSNPNAVISPTSRMQALGKTPSWYNSNGQAAGISEWTSRIATEQDIERWSKRDDYGICCQTRFLRAFDIDVEDPHSAEIIKDRILEMFGGPGSAPVRMRSNSGKLLIPFYYDGELYKRKFGCKLGGIVELLATGQQFVMYGTHPSGVRYEWEGKPEDAPVLTEPELKEIWSILVNEFAVPDTVSEGRKAHAASGVHRPDIDDPVYQYLESHDMVLDLDDRKGHAHIVCPFEDEHSTHTLTSTTYMLKGSSGYEAGHFSCLHASCANRNDTDFLNKCGFTVAQFDEAGTHATEVLSATAQELIDGPEEVPLIDRLLPPPDPPGRMVKAQYDAPTVGEESNDDWPAFFRNKNGEIDSTIDNLVRALNSFVFTGARVYYDDFLNRVMVDFDNGKIKRMEDVDYVRLRRAVERRGFKPVSQELMRHACMLVADENRINTAQAWLNSLRWDGVQRVDKLMRDYYKVTDDDAYADAVGRYLMTALAARVLHPGCKVDMVPILTSAQGMVKTSSIEALAPFEEAFGELDLSLKEDDIARLLSGKMVVEMAELKGLKSKEIEHLRSFITRRYEEWVPKFQENPIRRPRTCVFMGTTNDLQMLVDPDGNRRWLPCVVSDQVDVLAIKRDRDQLWAEGAAIVRERVAGGLDPVQWEEAHKLGKSKQMMHQVDDPIVEAVHEWLEAECVEFGEDQHVKNCEKPFTLATIVKGLSPALTRGISVNVLTKRVPVILRDAGYENKNVKIDKHTVNKLWVRALV